MSLLLLVEDEALLRWALAKRLRNAGHVVHEAPTIAAADDHIRRHRPDIVLLDIHLPDGNGLNFLATNREALSESSVIVMTAEGTIDDAVRAMKLGAWDFLTKPVDQDELLRLIDKAGALRVQGLEAEGSRRLRDKQLQMNIVAESRAMKETLRLATKVASASGTTVLIHGETGAGKEVVARYIHAHSARADGPLQATNCAAIPEQLVESELFGYEKGAFTDAKTSRKGLFELAHGGTVVLDEIGEVPLAMQSKLLRFLEERSLRRVGGSREVPVDVRVLALTNRDLQEHIAAGRFRSDLYFRLNVFPIVVPPLRDRKDDILPLAKAFMAHSASSCGKKLRAIAPDFEQWLLGHDWPGNIRELKNLVERAVILESGDELTGESMTLVSAVPARAAAHGQIVPLDEIEHVMVVRAMLSAEGNQSKAARMLKVSRDQLRYRMKRYREEGRLPAELGASVDEG
ncbi:MAG: sigma-54-dependent transcriptional regulator [Thermoanaerobaculia bacterium]